LLYTKDAELLKLGLIFPVMDLLTIAAVFSSPSIAKSSIARLVFKISNKKVKMISVVCAHEELAVFACYSSRDLLHARKTHCFGLLRPKRSARRVEKEGLERGESEVKEFCHSVWCKE